MRRGAEAIVFWGTLGVSGLIVGACSPGDSPAAERAALTTAQTIEPTTTTSFDVSELLPPTTTTTEAAQLLTDEQARQRLEALRETGLYRLLEDFHRTSRLYVFRGLCVGWQGNGGYTVTVNPAWVIVSTDSEIVSFFVYSKSKTGASPPNGPNRSQLELLDGAAEFAQLNSSGYTVPGSQLGQDVDLYAGDGIDPSALIGEDVTVDQRLHQFGPDDHWGLKDSLSGEEVVMTRFFPGKNEADLPALCSLMGLSPKGTRIVS